MADPGDDQPHLSDRVLAPQGRGLLGGALFLSAQLPTLTLNNAELRHVGEKSPRRSTKVAVNHTWGDVTFQRGIDKESRALEVDRARGCRRTAAAAARFRRRS